MRAFALRVVTGTTLADKLAPPDDLVDRLSGDEAALRIAAPGRPANLAIASSRDVRVPPIEGMRDPQQRARILHALANHELQAIELFAWALLAYPDAPEAFRRGLLAILVDEQRHFGLYAERLATHGVAFGDHGVTGHFWNKLDHLTGPLEFVCAMALTFENANLDFAGDYARACRTCDPATAAVLDQVHADEIRHVHFGWIWLRRLAADVDPHAPRSGEAVAFDPWATYLAHVRFPLGPARARGANFDREARRRAGFDDAFIAKLEQTAPKRPSGQPRSQGDRAAPPKGGAK